MPRKKRKSREEKTVENYFPIDESDVEYSIEKKFSEIKPDIKMHVEIPVREKTEEELRADISKASVEKKYLKQDRKSLEKIEILSPVKASKKIRKKTSKKRARKKKEKKKTIKKKDYTISKIELKKHGGYELIITEKPQAALKISSALSVGGSVKKRNNQNIPYYEINRQGKRIVVACAVGHLFSLKQNSLNSSKGPVFDISWVPNYLVKKNDFTKKYYDTILKLVKNAGEITVATDYDVEGELIGWNVVRFICGQKDANRMKFSTLTTKELNDSYDNKSKSINWGQAIAGETRHYLDWFYGINLSRALMNAIKSRGKFRIMSIGRVQGPALNLIVQKEREIQKFKPKPYWQVFISVLDSKGAVLELKHNKDIFDKSDLNKFKELKGKTAQASTKKTQQVLSPNPPFNLTSLQTEAYKFYGITPSETLRAAQSLYLSGLISYPRTSSQKLPESIGYKEILKKLVPVYGVERLIKKEKPVEGKKSDPAHPSIYPTAQSLNPILAGNEEKIYNLIVKRFLSLFCEDAVIDNKTVTVEIDGLDFKAKGLSVKKKSWMEIYPAKLKETEIQDMNGEVEVTSSKVEEKETKPPKRYSPASLVSELEKRNLGTKATRANIIETLYDRGYIKEKSIEATALGMSLISTLEKNSPIIIDEALTRNFEEEMERIQQVKDHFKDKEASLINAAKNNIIEISKQFEKNEKSIGEELLNANIEMREQQRKENTLVECPVCKKGNLAITYSKKTKRHFVACNAYPECKNTYSLPPNGTIKKTEQVCEECGFPKLMLLKKGRRPWFFCFNSECPTNKERLEEYRKKKEQEETGS